MAQIPMFSVVITTYNRAKLVVRALESLLRQSLSDWEAIIVDDGSTDITHEKLLPYLQSEPRLKYLLKTHSGSAPSKNHGIEASSGKFITFLDSDDEYHPSHLATRKDFLLRDPGTRFLHGGVKVLGNQYVPDIYNPSRLINLKYCVIGGTFFIEKETLLSLGGLKDLSLGSDHDLYQRAREKDIKMARIEEPTYFYHRENPNSVTRDIEIIHRGQAGS
jgi:glycosyltransferase involved in cell wall biosynthesis